MIIIYTTSPLRFLTSASGKRSISGSGGSSSSESLSSRARLSAGLGTAWGNRGETVGETVGKPLGKLGKLGKLGNTMENAPKVWKWLKTHQFLLSDNFWDGDDFHIGLWKRLDSGNGQAKMVTFSSPSHPSCSQVATANQAKGQKKGWSPDADLHGDIYREMKGGNIWQPSPADIHGFPSTAQPQNQEKWSW